jgi:V8-like Glu-specific endopeptidase
MDDISLITTPIELLDNDKVVSQGTGFYVAHQYEGTDVVFLVTNYHVLTGSSPVENKKNIGNNIKFNLHISKDNPEKVKEFRLPLYTKEGNPIWLINENNTEADLAIIPMPSIVYEEADIVNCINEKWSKNELKIRTTTSTAVVGYPYGYFDKKNSLPIWKTGSIASEPEVDFDGKKLIVLDISAFPGMSGAPVFARVQGMYETEAGGMKSGRINKFLGVYASMQMLNKTKFLEQLINQTNVGIKDQESLQLGHVWKASLIFEVLNDFDIDIYTVNILRKI